MFKVRQIKRVITGKSFGHCPVPVRKYHDDNDDDDDDDDDNDDDDDGLPIAPPEGRHAP